MISFPSSSTISSHKTLRNLSLSVIFHQKSAVRGCPGGAASRRKLPRPGHYPINNLSIVIACWKSCDRFYPMGTLKLLRYANYDEHILLGLSRLIFYPNKD